MISTINQRVTSLLVAMLLGVFGVVMTPKAAQANYPPAPTAFDRCGTVQDETYIPLVEGVSYSRDSVGLTEDSYHPTGGASTITIVADYIVYGADGWGYHEYQTFNLTFDVSSPNGCQQAADTGSVSVGACNPNTGLTEITIRFTNKGDATGSYDEFVHLMAYGSSGIAWSVPVEVGRVNDGQTVSWTGGQSLTQPVYPSHYDGHFTAANPNRMLLDNVDFTVPACGNYPLVEYDDGGSGGGGSGGTTVRPVADLKLIRCKTGKVKATLDNRGVVTASRFKLVQNPLSGKTVVRTYKVKPGAKSPVYRTGTNTVYKVQVWDVKIKQWVELARLRTRPTSRCSG